MPKSVFSEKTDLSALASTNPELLAVDEIEDQLLALIKEPALTG